MSITELPNTLDFHRLQIQNCAKDLPFGQREYLRGAFEVIAQAYSAQANRHPSLNPDAAYVTFCLDRSLEEILGNLRDKYNVDFYTTAIQGAIPPHSHLRVATPQGEVVIDFEWREFHPEWGIRPIDLPPILIVASEELIPTLERYGLRDVSDRDTIRYAGHLPWNGAVKVESTNANGQR